MNQSKILLIVDPQYDFISGSLPVPGATEAMEQLAVYIKENSSQYERIVLTSDWHPYDHSSFKKQGGPWPEHCVQHSQGAAIYAPLLKAANESECPVEVLYKGNIKDREEYSIFGNEFSAKRLTEIFESGDIQQIDVCGLAGDVCVLNTWQDGKERFPSRTFSVLEPFAPSLDGGKKLREAMEF